MLFAYMASITTRIKFFTGVLILPQRQATLVAKQAAEIGPPQRWAAMLGVGVGWNTLEYEALNEDFEHRGSRLEEQFDVMRRCGATTRSTSKAAGTTSSAPGSTRGRCSSRAAVDRRRSPSPPSTHRPDRRRLDCSHGAGRQRDPQVIREPWERVKQLRARGGA